VRLPRILRLFTVICLALAVAGCWSRRELTEVAFAGVMGVDWADGQYLVTVNVRSPRKGGESQAQGGPDIKTVSVAAHSIDEGVAKLDNILARSLTLAHIRSVTIGEEMAERGIGPILDHLLRTVEIRPTVRLGVAVGMARDLLQARPFGESAPGDGPLGYHETAMYRSSNVIARRLQEVGIILQEEGIDLTLPVFRLGNTPSPAENGAVSPSPEIQREVIYGGSALFRNDRMVGWLSPDATRGLANALDKAVHGGIIVPCKAPDRRMVFRMRKSEGSIRSSVVGGRLSGQIVVSIIADLNEVTCPEEVLRDGDVVYLQDALAREVRKNILEAFERACEAEADIFGFGEYTFRRSPQMFLGLAKHGYMSNMTVSVQVRPQVPRLGQLYRRYRWNER